MCISDDFGNQFFVFQVPKFKLEIVWMIHFLSILFFLSCVFGRCYFRRIFLIMHLRDVLIACLYEQGKKIFKFRMKCLSSLSLLEILLYDAIFCGFLRVLSYLHGHVCLLTSCESRRNARFFTSFQYIIMISCFDSKFHHVSTANWKAMCICACEFFACMCYRPLVSR